MLTLVVMTLGSGHLRPHAPWELCLSVITGVHTQKDSRRHKHTFVHATKLDGVKDGTFPLVILAAQSQTMPC